MEFRGTIASHFETIVHRYPGQLAAVYDSGEITYQQLNKAANRLAHRLLDIGQAGDRVALLPSQDSSTFVGMIGALKAGRIVVVLNPTDPAPRLKQLLADFEPATILAAEPHAPLTRQIAGATIEVVRTDDAYPDRPCGNPGLRLGVDDVAFLVYTSGSTGRPKGVIRPHGSMLQATAASARAIGLTPDDRMAILGAPWSGQGTTMPVMVFLTGATLAPFAAVENGVIGLAELLHRQRITVYHSSASLFRHFMRAVEPSASFPRVRVVRIGSEPSTGEDVAACHRHFPNATMFTSMGASEVGAVACSAAQPGASNAAGPVPVGRPYDGLDIRIVDEDAIECPPGVTGSLVVRSRHLAAGYWRDPELTARHFSREPDGTQVFRSNDLAYRNADGMIRIVGRQDTTYKIRGQRVDLAEVESALRELPGTGDVAALVSRRSNGEPYLIAFVVPAAGVEASPQRMRTIARGLLPRHLVPAAFVVVDALPRAGNGKVSRFRLQDMIPAARAGGGEPPATETEALLIRLWEEAFDLEAIGRSDDFFDLGGDSLIGAVIAAGVHAANGARLSFRSFVQFPVLKDLAAAVDDLGRRPEIDEAPLAPTLRDRPVPLSILQEPFWEDSRSPVHSRRRTRSSAVRIDGPLDIDAFRASLDYVIDRHESLRTRFGLDGDIPVQIVEAPAPTRLTVIDLSTDDNADAKLETLLNEERSRLFDLLAAPPLNLTLVRLGPDRHLFIRSCHHIISDGPSWRVFSRDLCHAYEAIIAGQEPSLPALPVQYRDYSIWQRRIWRRGGPRYAEAIAWWNEQLRREPGEPDIRTLVRYQRSKPAAASELDNWYFTWGIDLESSERLDRLGREHAATYYMVRVATVAPVLASLIERDKVVIGGIFSNRNRSELDEMFGLFANAVPLVLDCDWQASFHDHLDHVRQQILATQERAELPLSQLIAGLKEDNLDPPSLFFWVHLPTRNPPHRAGPLEFRSDIGFGRPLGGVTLGFNQVREDADCGLAFDARVYAMAGMRDFVDRLSRFIRAASRDPDATLRDLLCASGVEAETGSTASRSR